MSGLKLRFNGRETEMSDNGKPLLYRGYPLFPGDKERLEEIVRRDNAHEPLVDALKLCWRRLIRIEGPTSATDIAEAALNMIERAIIDQTVEIRRFVTLHEEARGEGWYVVETKETTPCKSCFGEMLVLRNVDQIVVFCPRGCRP